MLRLLALCNFIQLSQQTIHLIQLKQVQMGLRRKLFTLIAAICIINTVSAQEAWTLEQCILYAIDNSINIKRAEVGISQSEISVSQNKMNRLPNLGASVSGGFNFGRSINPTTNDFVQQNIVSNSFSLNSNMVLYAGNALNNQVKQSMIDREASKQNAAAIRNDIALNVANAFLNILLAEEQLENANNRLALSQQQLDQTQKRIEAGALPKNDELEFKAQMAAEQQAIIEAENLVAINYLNLKQLMMLDPGVGLVIEKPEILQSAFIDPDIFTLDEVFTQALSTQPNIKANELALRSAEIGEDLANSVGIPSVSLFLSMRTDFSDFLGNQTFSFPTADYFDQLDQNFRQNIGVSVNIPIFNQGQGGFTAKNNKEIARLNTIDRQLANEADRQTLRSEVQTAIANARASKRTYDAALVSLDAAQVAFDNAQRSFDLGAINAFEYSSARNRLDQAQVEVTRSKYQFIFNLKVVEFYQGKAIELN